jgi:plasmid stabilization system protein ParE
VNRRAKKIYRYRVKIQDEVVDELDSIYSFIFEDSPSRAKGFIRSLQKKILNLREWPLRGRRVQLLEGKGSPGKIRFVEHKGYLIFYTLHQKEVIVLHVTGPGQNWMQLFL